MHKFDSIKIKKVGHVGVINLGSCLARSLKLPKVVNISGSDAFWNSRMRIHNSKWQRWRP